MSVVTDFVSSNTWKWFFDDIFPAGNDHTIEFQTNCFDSFDHKQMNLFHHMHRFIFCVNL